MSNYVPEHSEADLLAELLGLLDQQGGYKLGMLMGTMSKGNLEHIRRLEDQLRDEKQAHNLLKIDFQGLTEELAGVRQGLGS